MNGKAEGTVVGPSSRVDVIDVQGVSHNPAATVNANFYGHTDRTHVPSQGRILCVADIRGWLTS